MQLVLAISGDFPISAICSWNVSRSKKLPKIHKNLYFSVQGHSRYCFQCQSKASVQLPISD